MSTPVKERLSALTEKEKETLRLIVRGHDAKSSARSLGLSVHTINERLRDARRKLAVSSSREAARMLLDAESSEAGTSHPDLSGDVEIGADAGHLAGDDGPAPIDGVGQARRRPTLLIGASVMTLALGLLALTTLPQVASAPPPQTTSQQAPSGEVVDAARAWLALLDQSRWDESYRATGTAFRALNTAQVWAAASRRVRAPLGAMISRTFISQENLPAPPHGYEVVKFRGTFANLAVAVETVTLDHEDGRWRVVGVTVG